MLVASWVHAALRMAIPPLMGEVASVEGQLGKEVAREGCVAGWAWLPALSV